MLARVDEQALEVELNMRAESIGCRLDVEPADEGRRWRATFTELGGGAILRSAEHDDKREALEALKIDTDSE
jgi:hypothetical protein